MSDEKLYLEATNEIEGENKDPALWAKVMALAEGDQGKAKYQYIKLRVEQLANKKEDEKPLFKNKIVDEFQLDYMPAAEFSKIKSIPEMKVIEMIRDGFYAGQVKDDVWFVSRDEVGGPQEKNKLLQTRNKAEQEYVPVEEFARYKNLDPEKAISMIREGFCQGRIKNNQWYVSVSEINGHPISKSSNKDRNSSCPLCGSPEWRLASVVRSEGLSHIRADSTGAAVGLSGGGLGVGLGSASMEGISQTALSQAASPPKDPRDLPFSALAIVLLSIGVFFIIDNTSSFLDPGVFSFFEGLGLIFLYGFFVIGFVLLLAKHWPASEYKRRMERWKLTRMCTRCGHFYYPGD
ncbi:sodium/calcium exchanger protein [Thiocapsa roseopersicina]|uniref:Uncharacterized protein n=1 Tax=Thiocapsa roseopersicina TaxID=1058 RepID=A0A1H2XUV7_THIRO|nr:sodium/calcium exchanger protein [Thiocapsa roseopersicina]SDW96693.1 hypothetical protein SAMN05421783_111124 [Thiocapsa roseopersicina]